MSRLVDELLVLVEKDDRATLAALRRGLGKPPGFAGEMHPFVIPKLPRSTQAGWNWEQQCYFMVASLFAWHPDNRNAGTPWERNFGASARQLKLKLEGADGPERRFVALLNTEGEDLPQHLRSLVGLFRAHDIAVDWEQLLQDVTMWDAPGRRVQIAWAKSFWASSIGSADNDDANSAADTENDHPNEGAQAAG